MGQKRKIEDMALAGDMPRVEDDVKAAAHGYVCLASDIFILRISS
jgi:hypothetical protein